VPPTPSLTLSGAMGSRHASFDLVLAIVACSRKRSLT
jgi:hypothetical protein